MRNAGAGKKALQHYCGLATYVLADPPRGSSEQFTLKLFVTSQMVFDDQFDVVPGYCIDVCLGADAMLKHYRWKPRKEQAVMYGFEVEELASMRATVGSGDGQCFS